MKNLIIILAALLVGCASYNDRYDPRAEFSLGGALHEEFRNGGRVVGDVYLSQKVHPNTDWLRLGVQHVSDPTTLHDKGSTWVKGTLVWGAGK